MDRKKLVLLLGALVVAIGTALVARSMFAGASAPQAAAAIAPVRAMLWPGGFSTPLADPELKGRVELLLPVPNSLTADALEAGQATYVPGHLHHTLARIGAGEPRIGQGLQPQAGPIGASVGSVVRSVQLLPPCGETGKADSSGGRLTGIEVGDGGDEPGQSAAVADQRRDSQRQGGAFGPLP